MLTNRCRVVIKSQLLTLHHWSSDPRADRLKINEQLIIAMIIPVSKLRYEPRQLRTNGTEFFRTYSQLPRWLAIIIAISMHIKVTEGFVIYLSIGKVSGYKQNTHVATDIVSQLQALSLDKLLIWIVICLFAQPT